MALGALENEIMRVLWARDRPLAVRDVLEAVNADRVTEPLAYTTVMTVLNRLVGKDVLERTRQGRGYLYRSLARDEAGVAVQEVLRRYGDAAVAHFLDSAAADPDARRRLRRLLDDE